MNLKYYRDAYDKGEPLIPDDVYDALVRIYGEPEGIGNADGDVKHYQRLYSLQKVFDAEPMPTACNSVELIKSPKLDGFAVALYYENGILNRGLTRGDGTLGKDITDKVLLLDSVPKNIEFRGGIQIVGEVLYTGNVDNQRNMASGSFGLKGLDEFRLRIKDLHFVCYSISDIGNKTYTEDMCICEAQGFETVIGLDPNKYLTDGTVYRANDNEYFYNQGYTAKHPRAAYAHKLRKDVAIKETELLNVIWQTGATGKVTPVAIVNETVIDGAKINRLTIHNVGYVEQLKLDIGDKLLISRSGGVIPKILANITKEVYLYDDSMPKL